MILHHQVFTYSFGVSRAKTYTATAREPSINSKKKHFGKRENTELVQFQKALMAKFALQNAKNMEF